MGAAKYEGTTRRNGRRNVWTGKISIDENALSAPLNWTRPRLIFVNSMSDLFHEAVSEHVIRQIWKVMGRAKQHTFQILTKRPERMAKFLLENGLDCLPNVWLGTSVESYSYITRIAHLQEAPAAIRFVSFEPLLAPVGDVDLTDVHWAIVGGESGPGARPMDPAWVDELQRVCAAQHVAFFFKQWGGVQKHRTGSLLNGRIVQEMPKAWSTSMHLMQLET
jgi:protein gp37